jgi:2-polyprenyl-3-methyl-5-hydroxy-6-metoxy-1,4-benzoquinol methylase
MANVREAAESVTRKLEFLAPERGACQSAGLTMDTKRFWEMHAEQDPYWAVVTWEQFKGLKDDAGRLDAFFATGEKHIADVMEMLAAFRPGFAPKTVLDFGCGVGRLLVPFANRGLEVSGVDISDKMLELSRGNLAARGLVPGHLVTAIEELPAPARYDLVHSFIVIQHIPRKLGIRIFAHLLDRVAEDGVAALHVTYSPTLRASEAWPYYLRARLKGWILDNKLLTATVQHLRGKPLTPPILMEDYPLNDVFACLHDKGFHSFSIKTTDHGYRGLVIFATRRAQPDVVF